MELTPEQKVEALTKRMIEIRTIIKDPLSYDKDLKLGKAAEVTFRALAEIGYPHGTWPIRLTG